MVRLKCPRCSTIIDVMGASTPMCPTCGFTGAPQAVRPDSPPPWPTLTHVGVPVAEPWPGVPVWVPPPATAMAWPPRGALRRPAAWITGGAVLVLLVASGFAFAILAPGWFGGGSGGAWPEGYLLAEDELPPDVRKMDGSSRGWSGTPMESSGKNPAPVPQEDLDAFLLHSQSPVEWWMEGLVSGPPSNEGLIWVNALRWRDAAAAQDADPGSLCIRPGSSFGMSKYILGAGDVSILITYSQDGDPEDQARAVHDRLLEKTPALRDLCA